MMPKKKQAIAVIILFFKTNNQQVVNIKYAITWYTLSMLEIFIFGALIVAKLKYSRVIVTILAIQIILARNKYFIRFCI